VTHCRNISAHYPLHILPDSASEHACPRYAARRRLDFAGNSTAGIVGIPEVDASTGYSNYASALYRFKRTLDPLFVADGGFRLALAAEGIPNGIAFVHSRKALRFSSTYRLS